MKKKTRGKRLLSMLLCFVMLLCLVPSVAFAAPAGAQPPTNLSWDGTTAKWENANEDGVVTSVRIELFNTKDNSYAAAFTDGGIFTSKDYSSHIIPGDTYYFKVQFKYSDNTKSDFVQSGNYTASGTYSLSAIQNLTLSADGKMTWTDTQYENRYSSQLFVKSGETWTAVTSPSWIPFNSSSYDWGTSAMEVGKTYRASLQAFQGPVAVSNLTYTNECTVSSSSTSDTTAIESIAVTIDAPTLGAMPDYTPTFTTTPIDAMTFYKMEWWKIAEDDYTGTYADLWSEITSDTETFEAGYYYSPVMYFKAKDGYEVVSNTVATINGQPHNNTSGDVDEAAWGDAYVSCDFAPLTTTPDVEEYDIWLGETQVTSANKDDILENGTASYNPDTKTLTLNGYNGQYIYAEQALTIDLADDTTNKITVPVDVEAYGIYTKGECKLTGGGNLEITVKHESYDGIWANYTTFADGDGNLIIDMSGNLTVNADGDGLFSNHDLTISGSGNVTITSGEDGLFALIGSIYINGSGNLTVNSGDDGIWADDAIVISGSRDITIASGFFGLYADEGSIDIGGSGNLTVDSAGDGIWAAYNIMISDSRNVTVNAVDRSLRPMGGRLILYGSGSVNATSTREYAVESNYDGPAVELNGTNPSVSFETAGEGKQAVYNNRSSGTLVSGTNIANYNVTGTLNERSVVYTLKHTHTLQKTEAKVATCTKPGNNAYWTCSGCAKVYKDEAGTQETTVAAETIAVNPANHRDTTKTLKNDENQHWYELDCCGAVDGEKENHTPGEWIIDTSATATTDGSKHKECIVCHFTTHREEIPATGYTITFDANGGTTDVSTAQTDKNGKLTLTVLPEATRDGKYNFAGWFDAPRGGNKITTDTIFTENTTVYAHWTYTGGGSGGGGGTVLPIYHTIKATAGVGGSISPDGTKSLLNGGSQTYTITPDSGYQISDVKVDGKSVGAVKTYTFRNVKENHTIQAVFEKVKTNPNTGAFPFVDVSTSDWFFGDVAYVYDHDLMNGTSDTTFAPNLTTSRAMIVTILYRLEGEPTVTGTSSFSDVEKNTWYSKAVVWAEQNGIVKGYDNGKFGVNDDITREQLAAILYRYMQFKGMDAVTMSENLTSFSDHEQVSGYAVQAMNWAVANNLINGADNKLMPTDGATRAQVAAILHRFCENVLK